MKQKFSISVFLLFFSCMIAWAQEWSKEDSIWLKNVLEGKEELKINEDTKKAIQEGRLITPLWMQSNDENSNLELLKNFDNVGEPDDSMRIRYFDPLTMPPAVFALYVLYLDRMDSMYAVKSLIITEDERKQLEALLPTGTVQAFSPYISNTSPSSGTLMVTDFNHLLSMVFSSQYRRIAHNRKHATAYRNYYDNGPAPGAIRFTEQERKKLMKSVNSYKPPFKVSFGSKINGIDD